MNRDWTCNEISLINDMIDMEERLQKQIEELSTRLDELEERLSDDGK